LILLENVLPIVPSEIILTFAGLMSVKSHLSILTLFIIATIASFFSLGYALMQVPSGMLAEKFGPRKMITIALVWWSAFTILT
ncbi:MFS transporter, partial [Staphylococcus sp. EG-SA-26]|uniref:MFS transporter n=1 Tax=Staphylococcus sp. EG-SA-26 TaxID=2767498 RepID=UPI001F11C338